MTDSETITVHVGIGNSDDKLSQAEWHWFVGNLRTIARNFGSPFLGIWHSAPAERWQNCQVAWEMPPAFLDDLKVELRKLRAQFGQDSIALCYGPTELI